VAAILPVLAAIFPKPFSIVPLLSLTNPLISHDPQIRFVGTLAAAVAILVLTYLVSRVASGRLRRVVAGTGIPLNVAILTARAFWAALWAVGIFWILYLLGVGLAPLAAFIGVVGLAASLSFQAVLQNLVAGVYLLGERPFHIGDVIAVVGPAGVNHEGRVEDIQMRTTHLRSFDDELILVPNSAIFSGVITNRTAVGGYVSNVTITFPRSTEPDSVRQRAVALIQESPVALRQPEPQLRVSTIEKDTWTGCLAFWISQREATSQLIWQLAEAFPESTINGGGDST
jgi:small conductance mechanosensitive channel